MKKPGLSLPLEKEFKKRLKFIIYKNLKNLRIKKLLEARL
jgi:hypothetical protein